MKSKIKSLVINPPFLEPHRPPISCAIIAEVLRLEGHNVEVSDLNIELFNKFGSSKFNELKMDQIYSGKPEISKDISDSMISFLNEYDLKSYEWILLSSFSFWNNKMSQWICEYLRKNSNAKIVIGGSGIETDNFGEHLYNKNLVDFYILGEGEIVLKELINGNTTYPGINGTDPIQINDIENLPLPNYSYFNLDSYDSLLEDLDVFLYGSRGCVRKCTFCNIEVYWPKFRWRSGQSIAQEMIDNYEKHGLYNFYFSDSLVNGNLDEFRTMCEILANYKEGLFNWGGFGIIRPKKAHPASHYDLIKAGGGRYWSIGVETGVDRIRYEMKKKFSNDDIEWHLEQSQRIGLQNNFLMIPTWPSETLEEHNEYLKIFKRWAPYAADGTISAITFQSTLMVMEGTRLYDLKDKQFVFEEFDDPDISDTIRYMSWRPIHNTSLTHKEKFRRTLDIFEESIKWNWPVVEQERILMELKNAAINWKKHSSSIVKKKTINIPIRIEG